VSKVTKMSIVTKLFSAVVYSNRVFGPLSSQSVSLGLNHDV
jgi:hypothetical protein